MDITENMYRDFAESPEGKAYFKRVGLVYEIRNMFDVLQRKLIGYQLRVLRVNEEIPETMQVGDILTIDGVSPAVYFSVAEFETEIDVYDDFFGEDDLPNFEFIKMDELRILVSETDV